MPRPTSSRKETLIGFFKGGFGSPFFFAAISDNQELWGETFQETVGLMTRETGRAPRQTGIAGPAKALGYTTYVEIGDDHEL